MQGYWENSVRNHLEKEKRKHHKRLEVKTMEVNNKYKVGDTVHVEGREGEFVIERWVCERSKDSDGIINESSYYDLRGKHRNSYLDFIEEEEIIPIKEALKIEVQVKDKEILTKMDIDFLLDKYNEFTELHNLLNSIGVHDDQYRERAEDILKFLQK